MLRVLLVTQLHGTHANTTIDHVSALRDRNDIDVIQISCFEVGRSAINFDDYDAIIIHYSVVFYSQIYLNSLSRDRIRGSRALKCAFIQDEYRYVNAVVDTLIDLGLDVLFTCVPETALDAIYGRLRRRGVRIEPTLTGYVPRNVAGLPRCLIKDRPLDIVYRSRQLPFVLGDLGQEKTFLADEMHKQAKRHCLKADVHASEEKRIYGAAWLDFMGSGRAALGSESGASICDFTGELNRTVDAYVERNPRATYADVRSAFLHEFEGNAVINAISPRAFEAAALGTALVQFPGDYSGVLQAGRHFVVLQKDFSNIGEVADAIRDTDRMQQMADFAYDDLIASGRYSYEAFSDAVYDVLRQEWEARIYRPPVALPSVAAEYGIRPPHVAVLPKQDLLDLATRRLPRDRALSNQGATVTASVAFFAPPHDLDYLLREPEEGLYAAAQPNQRVPQSITVTLGRQVRLSRIDLRWYDESTYPTQVDLELASDLGGSFRLFETLSPDGTPLSIELGGIRVRRLRLTARAFRGQQRWLLRNLQVWDQALNSEEVELDEAIDTQSGRRPRGVALAAAWRRAATRLRRVVKR